MCVYIFFIHGVTSQWTPRHYTYPSQIICSTVLLSTLTYTAQAEAEPNSSISWVPLYKEESKAIRASPQWGILMQSGPYCFIAPQGHLTLCLFLHFRCCVEGEWQTKDTYISWEKIYSADGGCNSVDRLGELTKGQRSEIIITIFSSHESLTFNRHVYELCFDYTSLKTVLHYCQLFSPEYKVRSLADTISI